MNLPPVQISRVAAALVLAASLLPAARAVTVYDEAVSGDLGGLQGSPTVLGNLSLGANLVLGHDSIASDTGGGQGDTFALKLLAGQTLQSVTLTVSHYSGDGTVQAKFYRPASPGFTFLGYQIVGPFAGDMVAHFTIPGGLTTETLGFSIQVATIGTVSPDLQWRWDIQTASAVPEAPPAALLAGGVGVLGLWARRRGSLRR